MATWNHFQPLLMSMWWVNSLVCQLKVDKVHQRCSPLAIQLGSKADTVVRGTLKGLGVTVAWLGGSG